MATKRTLLTVALMLVLLFSTLALFGCNNAEAPETELKVEFYSDGALYHAEVFKLGDTPTLPTAPTKDGYTFDGWYHDNGEWENSLEILSVTESIKVYAKFTSLHSHSYIEAMTSPTCTERGYTTHTCACGVSYVDTYTEALGHSFTNYISDGNATCTNDGTATATCDIKDCYKTDTKADLNSKLGHSFTNYISDGNATCTNDGTATATCDIKDCYETDTKADLNSKLGHSFTNYTSDGNATCTEDGTETATCDAINCSVTDTKSELNSKLGHSFINYVSNGDATYEAEGTETAVCDNDSCEFENTRAVEGLKATLGLTYEPTADGTAYICTDIGTATDTNIIVSAKYNNLPVTGIGDRAFANCDNITSITFPKSITSIGEDAFSSCTSLTAVHIGDIESWLKISFGNEYANPIYCAGRLYLSGTLATEITIPSSVTEINAYAFYGCVNLTSITITQGVTSIGNYSFFGCYKLIEVYNLSSLNITSGDTGSGYTGYYALDVYTSKNTPSKLTTTSAGYIFYEDGYTVYLIGYKGDKAELVLPNMHRGKDYSIYRYAFSGYTGLTSITISTLIDGIGAYAFRDCTSLTEINYNATLNDFLSIPHVFYNAGANGTGITVNIGANVYSIPAYLFYTGDSSTSPKITSVVFAEGGRCTSIGASAFAYCTFLESVTIPTSIASIGGSAFSNCYRLVEVYNLSSLNISKGNSSNGYIGYYALDVYTSKNTPSKLTTTSDGYTFYEQGDAIYLVGYKEADTELLLPDKYNGKNYSIYNYAFYGCSSLEDIIIPKGVTSIGEYAFAYCTSLSSITIPQSVTSISYRAFYNSNSLNAVHINDIESWIKVGFASDSNPLYYAGNLYLNGELVTELIIPSAITKINDRVFYGCTSLEAVRFEESSQLESIGYSAFEGCTSLEFIMIPARVKLIEDYAFYKCSNLKETSLAVNSLLERISYCAFYGCDSLSSITIPQNITSIGDNAFAYCTALTNINYNATAMDDLSSNNYVFYNAGTNGTGITVTIGANVTKLPTYLFYTKNNDNSYSSKITSVVFADGTLCTSIGEYAFAYCTGLSRITIPQSITSIGEYAFAYCTGLSRITIPQSITSIGAYAFRDCTSLTEINYNASLNDFLSIPHVFYNAGANGTGITVNIGANVAKIPAYLFATNNDDISYSPKITSVVFADGTLCTSIGEYAFLHCTGLSRITIPHSITSIGELAFCNCTSLESITIPASVTSIGYAAFAGCTLLSEINYNASALDNLSIDSDIFYSGGIYGTGITVNIGANVTQIPAYLFYTGKITSVVFPENSQCASIGDYAFYNRTSLTGVEMPESITSIGEYAFLGCTSLKSITIPESVTSIGAYAFAGCTSLSTITFDDTPSWFITLSSNFTGTHIVVTDEYMNAMYLKSTYMSYYWYKK